MVEVNKMTNEEIKKLTDEELCKMWESTDVAVVFPRVFEFKAFQKICNLRGDLLTEISSRVGIEPYKEFIDDNISLHQILNCKDTCSDLMTELYEFLELANPK